MLPASESGVAILICAPGELWPGVCWTTFQWRRGTFQSLVSPERATCSGLFLISRSALISECLLVTYSLLHIEVWPTLLIFLFAW
jgi:hypothetical protein